MMMGMGSEHFIGMIIVWAIILGGSVWLLAVLFPRPPVEQANKEREPEESALAILQRRYARGELTRGEFEEIRRDLGQA